MSEENNKTAVAADDGKVEANSSLHRARQEKVNAVLASGRYILIPSTGELVVSDMSPAESYSLLNSALTVVTPMLMQGIVNDTLKAIYKQTADETKKSEAAETKSEEVK